MPDLHVVTPPMAVVAQEADARCRGIGARPAAVGEPRVSASGGVPSSAPADVPAGRSVVREAVRLAAAEAVTQEVHDRVAGLGRLGPTGVAAADATPAEGPAEGPSPELVRLLAHLRSTVTRYVRERRDGGAPVERIVPEVKCLVREAASCEGWLDPGDTLTAQVVRWAITAYFDQPELAHVPRFY